MTDDSNTQSPTTPNGPDRIPDQVKTDLNAATGSVGAAVEDVRKEAVSQAQEIKEAAAAQMASVADKAKGLAAEKKDEAADQLGGVSSAISKVADELGQNENTAAVAGYARDLAGGLQRISETVKRNSVDDIIGIVEDFGRRQPVAFLGAAALAGFVASRFVLASAERRAESTATQTYGGATSTPRPYGGQAAPVYSNASDWTDSSNEGDFQ